MAIFYFPSISLQLIVLCGLITIRGILCCPVGCQCQPSTSWWCHNVNISSIAQAVNTSHVTRLSIDNTHFDLDDQTLPSKVFRQFHNLVSLELILENLRTINKTSFYGLNNLQELAIIGCHKLSKFPTLLMLSKLEKVIIRGSKIATIPENSFHNLLKINNIQLDSNKISKIQEFVFNNTGGAYGITINLANNPLKEMHAKAFEHLNPSSIGLISLDITKTDLEYLPVPNNPKDFSKNGLKSLRQLRAKAEAFKRLPLPQQIPQVQKIQVHYPYLCCIFHRHQTEERLKQFQSSNLRPQPRKENPTTKVDAMQAIRSPVNNNDEDYDERGYHDDDEVSDYKSKNHVLSKRRAQSTASQAATFGEFLFPTLFTPTKGDTGIINQGGGGFSGNKTTVDGNITDLHQWNTNSSHFNCTPDQADCLDGYGGLKLVQCLPQPNELTPCEDMLGDWYLKISEWIMCFISLLANTLVLMVILNAEGHLTVTKFLICNLAFADFCMGIYLALMAITDLTTANQYANYAINWQTGGGCATAGFIAIFSAELSTMTLTVITIERYLAIVHAMYYEKQLKLFGACIAMSICWILSIVLALLPIVGVNSYSLICICLPADFTSSMSVGYILILVGINALAFILIVYSYCVMYYTVHSTHSSGGNRATQEADRRIARRMALLIFTNFACWTPIAFFGFGAALKLNLITVSSAKFLLVFIFPINATANPFLYSIFNQLFRKDLHHVIAKWNLNCSYRRRRLSSATNANLSHNTGMKSRSTRASSLIVDSRKRNSSVGGDRLSVSVFGGLTRILKLSNSPADNANLAGSNSSIGHQPRCSMVSTEDRAGEVLSAEIIREQQIDRSYRKIKPAKRYSQALKCDLSDIKEMSYIDDCQVSKNAQLHKSSQLLRRDCIETVV